MLNSKFLSVSTLLTIILFATACSTKYLPKELSLSSPIYKKEQQHAFGPGGMNQSFYVYTIPKETMDKVLSGGIKYLNTLPSSKKAEIKKNKIIEQKIKGEHFGPFYAGYSGWRITPVAKDKKWLSRSLDLGENWVPSLATFFARWKGDTSNDEFVSSISKNFSESFHKAISEPGNYYAYGGYRDMCLILIVPSQGYVYYVFRD